MGRLWFATKLFILFAPIVSVANKLASEASLAKFGAKRQFFASSLWKTLQYIYALSLIYKTKMINLNF